MSFTLVSCDTNPLKVIKMHVSSRDASVIEITQIQTAIVGDENTTDLHIKIFEVMHTHD